MTLRTGLLVLPSRPAPELATLAQRAEALGYDDFWIADERFFREVYGCLALCALRTSRIRLGPCVTDPYSRHPALTAMAIATLDELADRRAVLGMGAGVSGFRELGIKADRPAVAIREAVDLIRRLLIGESVMVKGDFVRFQDGRLDFIPLRSEIPIYVASQRPMGCKVAGAIADGAIMQGPVADPLLRFFCETVAGGARRAGREANAIDLVARVNVCIDDDRAAARDVMRPTIVRSLVAQRPDFFTFTTAGLGMPPALAEKVLALDYTHDPAPLRAVAAEVPDEFVDAVTLAGPPQHVAAELVRMARSGITNVLVYPLDIEGRTEATVERFQREVVPRMRELLDGSASRAAGAMPEARGPRGER